MRVVLSQEVARLIESALTPVHRIVLMTLYATGLRRATLIRLKVADINTERMVIHVLGAKGRKDCDLILSPKLLEELRQYWRSLQHKPRTRRLLGGAGNLKHGHRADGGDPVAGGIAADEPRSIGVPGWRRLYNRCGTARKLRKWYDTLCSSSANCTETVAAVLMLIADDHKNTQDVLKVPGIVEDDLADMVRYGIGSYLSAEPKAPTDVARAEAYARYQDPTARAMAMLKLSAEQASRAGRKTDAQAV